MANAAPIDSVCEVIKQSWQGGETAMRKRVLAEISFARSMAQVRGGAVDFDDMVASIEAIPLTEAKK